MQKRFIYFIIITQIFIGVIIIYHIYQQKQVLGVISVNPIKKEDITFSPTGNLKYFYEPKANSEIKDNLLGTNSVIHYNNDTLNAIIDYAIAKPPKTYRIIVLGSSFANGDSINTKDNWSSILQGKLNSELQCKNISKYEVINLGVGGYDNVYSLERLKKRGLKYSPDLILWYQTNADLMRYIELYEGNIMSKMSQLIKSSMSAKLRYDISTKIYLEESEKVYENLGYEKSNNIQSSIFNSFHALFKGHAAFILNPDITSENENYLQKQAANYNYGLTIIRNFTKMDGILRDGHPNIKGHKIIAEDIFDYLKNSNIVPCKK